MDVTPNDLGATSRIERSNYSDDPTDRPIPVWPEGVVAVVATLALIVIGLKHRTWLQKKGREVQSAVQEFQKHGGLTELTEVAQHASELLKGSKG